MRFLLTLFLIVTALVVTVPEVSYAQSPDKRGETRQPQHDDVEEFRKNNPNSLVSKKDGNGQSVGTGIFLCIHEGPPGISRAAWQNKYTARFTYCMREMLEVATGDMLDAIKNYMDAAVYAVIFLATVIMGIKAVGGMFRNVKVESALFVAKIIAVVVLFNSMPTIADLSYNTTDKILSMLAKGGAATFNASNPSGGFSCEGVMRPQDYGDYEWIGIYDWMDCLGKATFDIARDDAVKSSFIAIAGSAMFTGTSGAHASMAFFSFFISLGFFLFRAATMIVMAYGGISLLMLMFPVLLLTIFFKITESYFFQRWLSNLMKMMVKPAVMLGFLYFALAALDTMMFQGSHGYYYKYDANGIPNPNTGVIERDAAGNPLVTTELTRTGLSNPPSAEHEQVVKPVHKVLKLEHDAGSTEYANQLMRIFTAPEPLFTIEVKHDNAMMEFLMHSCYGEQQELGDDEILQNALDKWDTSPELQELFKEKDLLRQAMEDAMQANEDNSEVLAAKQIACAMGWVAKQGLRFNIADFRDRVQAELNSIIPEIRRLNLAPLADPGEDSAKAHEKRMNQLVYAMLSVFILASTLFIYTGHIERMASRVAGRMGMSLSINSSSGGGATLGKAIKTGMNTMEDGWTRALKNPNSSMVDKVGGGAIKGLLGGGR